jgi:hypothetical protein
MRPFFIITLLALFGCDANNTPSSATEKATRPAWLRPAMVDSVRLAMEQGEHDAIQQLRNGWILTGDDTLQIEFFCRHAGFREAFPQMCK